jgi:predicted aconitase with swiveling domain
MKVKKEGGKETSKREKSEVSTQKTIGRILIVSAFGILIVNFALMNMKDKDLATVGLLLLIATFMLVTGTILSHLPQKETEGKRKNVK